MSKSVNPYEKKNKKKLRITRKQWIVIICVICVAALIGGISLAMKLGNNGGHYEGDGHNHGTSQGDGHYEGDGHDHGTGNSDAKVKYQIYTNADQTYRVVFRDNAGKTLAEYDKIAKQPIHETIDETKGIYELGWATGNGANEFECVYYNVKTGQLSDKFVAPRGTDGVRIAYGSEDQTKVVVQDLFDKTAYYKEHALKAPETNKNGDIIVGGRLHENKKTVIISYNSTETESTAHATIELYE